MTHASDFLGWLLLALAGAAFATFIAWRVIEPSAGFAKFARGFYERRIDYLLRLWRFAGPRLTHWPTISIVLANAAMFASVDVESLKPFGLALWLIANLAFPVWGDLPDERLAPASPPRGVAV